MEKHGNGRKPCPIIRCCPFGVSCGKLPLCRRTSPNFPLLPAGCPHALFVEGELLASLIVFLPLSEFHGVTARPQTPTQSGSITPTSPSEAVPGRAIAIMPEMKSYTVVFRFGHAWLVPTFVGDANLPAQLFLLDTGAFGSQITPAAANEVTHVHGDSYTKVKGVNGSVDKIYRGDKAMLRFGHLKQENQDLVAFDLSHLSDQVGSEVSGLLGFNMLRLLDIKIDYRDGLVDFSYDPKRWNH